MEMKDVLALAKERMKGYCRVCPVCDGKVCSGETPGMGGCGTGSAFHNNINALKKVRFNMRLIHDVKNPDTSCNFLDIQLAAPIIAAPIGGVSFNMGGAITEEAYINAIINGSQKSGTIGCTGDGVPAFIHEAGFEAIRQANGHGIPFIKPWDSEELDEKISKAQATKCPIIGMDIDAAGLITLAKMGRPVSPKNLPELKKIVDSIHAMGKKFILKGVMTEADALCAVEAGCDAIVVSNHGGRVLDHTPGVAEVLPHIAQKVKSKITIIADGGVRDGGDVFKLIALGADAIMIGRPYSIAALGGEEEAVSLYTNTLIGQLTQVMVLTGCPSIDSIKSQGLSLVNISH